MKVKSKWHLAALWIVYKTFGFERRKKSIFFFIPRPVKNLSINCSTVVTVVMIFLFNTLVKTLKSQWRSCAYNKSSTTTKNDYKIEKLFLCLCSSISRFDFASSSSSSSSLVVNETRNQLLWLRYIIDEFHKPRELNVVSSQCDDFSECRMLYLQFFFFFVWASLLWLSW